MLRLPTVNTMLEWPSHRLHGFEVVAGGQEQAGRAVAQVMQPDRRQIGVPDQAGEQLAEPVGFDRVAAGVDEDEATPVALEGGAGR